MLVITATHRELKCNILGLGGYVRQTIAEVEKSLSSSGNMKIGTAKKGKTKTLSKKSKSSKNASKKKSKKKKKSTKISSAKTTSQESPLDKTLGEIRQPLVLKEVSRRRTMLEQATKLHCITAEYFFIALNTLSSILAVDYKNISNLVPQEQAQFLEDLGSFSELSAEAIELSKDQGTLSQIIESRKQAIQFWNDAGFNPYLEIMIMNTLLYVFRSKIF